MKRVHTMVVQGTRRPWVRLLVLGLMLGFAFQGSRGLWSPDEGRYANGAVMMLESGNFLVPAYSPDRINLAKPPMTYWIIAASVKVFGHNTWAVRAPYALAFVLTMLLLHGMGTRLVPAKPWLPGLFYGAAVLPFLATNIVSTDVFLTLFEAVAALGFVRLSFGDRQYRQPLDAILMWLGLGLAFLTKGPPGLILLLAVVPFTIMRDGWRGLGHIFAPPGPLVFLVVGLLWYAIVVVREPTALHHFLHREVYERLLTGVQRRHPGAFGWLVVYLPTLAIGSLPWWTALVRRQHRRDADPKPGSWWQRHPSETFMLLWLLIPLVAFCLAQSRLPLYMLPLFLPISLLLALRLRDDINLDKRWQRALLCGWLVVLLALKGGVAYGVHSAADNRLAAQQLVAKVPSDAYAAMVFVTDTAEVYAMKGQIPWGLSLYLDKPIYGIAWGAPEGAARLCSAVHDQRSNLLLLDATRAPAVVDLLENRCLAGSIIHAGDWRQYVLVLVKN